MKRPYGRLNAQHAAGARAVPVHVCTNPRCEIHHRPRPQGEGCICWGKGCLGAKGKPPVQCRCGGIEFIKFPSTGEADHWHDLRKLEKQGIITNLRRQIWYPLYATDPEGHQVIVTHYVADFVWEEDGDTYIGDSKPRAGVDDLADLKIRWMEVQGNPVNVITKRITR